jgi:hypothetical protein
MNIDSKLLNTVMQQIESNDNLTIVQILKMNMFEYKKDLIVRAKIFYNEFIEGEQNRFRNNDLRSFEEWLTDKIENEC